MPNSFSLEEIEALIVLMKKHDINEVTVNDIHIVFNPKDEDDTYEIEQ
jgi:hypothetical protein